MPGKQTDEPKVKVHAPGQGGVQLVKDALQLSDDEVTQAQNAEIVPDINAGGKGTFSMRGGLAALTTALAGSILGILSLPLLTTYTRTLYASLGNVDSDTWIKSTNGTAWTSTTSPIRASRTTSDTFGTSAHGYSKAAVAFKTGILYPSDSYVQDLATPTNNTPPPMAFWDGTSAVELFQLPAVGSSDGNYPFKITDMLVANGKVYFAIQSSPNTGTLRGAVLALNMATGQISQVGAVFGGGTGEQTGGAPSCIECYQGQIWVGLSLGNGTANVGYIVKCFPDVDTAWTVDTQTLGGYPMSIRQHLGDLYVGARGNATNDAAVYKRAGSTGAWTTSDTVVTSGIDYYSGLIVFNGLLYATVFSDGGADILHVRSLSAGSWGTDLDIDAVYTAGVAQHVGQPQIFGGSLYLPIESTAHGTANGMILKRTTGGVWSQVVTLEDINGRLVTLLARS